MMNRKVMLRLFDEIVLVYLSKNVNNIFKITLIEILQEKLNIKSDVVSRYMDRLLAVQGLEVFTVLQSVRKITVIQIHRKKLKAARMTLESLI
jgi:hypothetical protein